MLAVSDELRRELKGTLFNVNLDGRQLKATFTNIFGLSSNFVDI